MCVCAWVSVRVCLNTCMTVCLRCLWGVLRCVSLFDVWHWVYKRVGFKGMNFALVCVCVCVCQPAEWMWFTLHWPPVSHRQKLVSLVLMGCRAEEEGAVRMCQQGCCWGFEGCVCLWVCVCVVVGTWANHFWNCIFTLPSWGRETWRQGIDRTKEPFVSHLSVATVCACVCLCVRMHVCG